MLFDERELVVFATEESRRFFKDILQTYYSQNYRATIVLLYSFVVYDLFEKIKVMANEGNTDAKTIISEVTKDFSNNEKYSEIENKILQFFTEKYSSYFNNFIHDINYLKDYRHKCAHLNLSGNSLFVPKDYQVRMLICSMFDNVFSVRAPFITDLFQFVQNDIENFSSLRTTINDDICKKLENDYYSRMTNSSIVKSLHTFIKLLFLSDDSEAIKNSYGLLLFTFSLSTYAMDQGLDKVLGDQTIIDLIPRMSFEEISKNNDRKEAFYYMLCNVGSFEKMVRNRNPQLFNESTNALFNNSNYFVQYYDKIFSRKNDSKYLYFIAHKDDITIIDSKKLYDYLKNDPKFSLDEFVTTLCSKISRYYAFSAADEFMDFFISVFSELESDTIKKVFKIYEMNDQCYNRSKHNTDINRIKELNDSLATPFNLQELSYYFR